MAFNGGSPRQHAEDGKRHADTEEGKALTQEIFGNVLPKDNK
jgi:hypothetical protein